jgi:hypothetical protein
MSCCRALRASLCAWTRASWLFSMSSERYDSLVRIVGARIYESATKMSDDGQDNWNG